MNSSAFLSQLANSNTQYLFAGYVTNRVLDGVAAGIEDVLSVQSDTTSKYRKIFSLFVEMVQNVIFYSAKRVHIDGDEAGYGMLEIKLDGSLVKVTSANPVTAAQREKLLKIMTDITSSTPEEISKAYKRKMMESFDDAESRGGGLG